MVDIIKLSPADTYAIKHQCTITKLINFIDGET